MKKILKKHAEKLRFAIVGGANTLIDFVILFTLFNFGLPTLFSNFISTSVALVFSFFANKQFTFKQSNSNTGRHFTLFLVITLTGLWIIQPSIIESFRLITISLNLDKKIILLISKLIATGVTLVWNYLLYKRFVFSNQTK